MGMHPSANQFQIQEKGNGFEIGPKFQIPRTHVEEGICLIVGWRADGWILYGEKKGKKIEKKRKVVDRDVQLAGGAGLCLLTNEEQHFISIGFH